MLRRLVMIPQFVFAILAGHVLTTVVSLNIVIPGGTGSLGRALSAKLRDHDVAILSRNAFLASAPSRVTNEFGWLGQTFLEKNPHIRVRDWDGGDLLDIVGSDWVGWQDDTLKHADVVINLVGGFTKQREMAAERIVRESLRVNPNALQITVSPREDEIQMISPGMYSVKKERLSLCEKMVSNNCPKSMCLRLEANNLEGACESITKAIKDLDVTK